MLHTGTKIIVEVQYHHSKSDTLVQQFHEATLCTIQVLSDLVKQRP